MHYPVCDNCGSDNVLFDAYVQWDRTAEEYTVHSVMSKPVVCEVCECEVTVTWKEMA